MTSTVDERILRRIGQAVQARGGPYEDAVHLADEWIRLRRVDLAQACAAHERGEHDRAKQLYTQLEQKWGHPLEDVGQDSEHKPSTNDARRKIQEAAPDVLRRIHQQRAEK